MPSGVLPFGHVCKDFYGSKIKNNHSGIRNTQRHIEVLNGYVNSFSYELKEPLYMKNQKDFDHKIINVSFLKK